MATTNCQQIDKGDIWKGINHFDQWEVTINVTSKFNSSLIQQMFG